MLPPTNVPPFNPLRSTPIFRPAEAPPPSSSFQEVAKEYVSKFCRSSKAFMDAKASHWELLENLYLNKIGIREWQSWKTGGTLSTSQSRYSIADFLSGSGTADADSELWQSDYVHAPGFLVDNFTDNAWNQIFSNPEFLTIVNESGDVHGSSDLTFPTARKIQKLLIDKLENGQIHNRMYECIQSCVCLGSVFAKVFWEEKKSPEYSWRINPMEAERVKDDGLVYESPILQIIPLDRVLPDPRALHSDLQRWRGIGHRVDRTYEDLIVNFKEDIFNLNESEFKQRWSRDEMDSGEGTPSDDHGLYYDPDSDISPDKQLWLEVWEWHGSVPWKGEYTECCCAIVTERGADSPIDGVMVRLTTRPLLDCGLRPFVLGHFIQRPGPLGVGIIEREEPILYQISQFIGQAQDNARATSNAIFQLDASSPAWKQIESNNNVLTPGMVLKKMAGDEQGLTPVQLPPFPSAEISSMVQFLSNILERHTAVTDTMQGMAQSRKTATEANILQQQGAVPAKARTNLFARSFIRQAFNLALAMMRQFADGEQTIIVTNASGIEVPVTITEEELQEGKYRVEPTLTKQDSTTIAKAQSIERILPNLARLQPLLMQEGVQISYTELTKRYMELLGIEGADRIIKPMPPQPPMMGGPPMNAPMGNLNGPGGLSGPPPSDRPPFLRPEPPNRPENKPKELLRKGGPMGQDQGDLNAMAQFLQLQSLQNQGGMPKGG